MGGGDKDSHRSVDFLQIIRITEAIFLFDQNYPDSLIGILLPEPFFKIQIAEGKKNDLQNTEKEIKGINQNSQSLCMYENGCHCRSVTLATSQQ